MKFWTRLRARLARFSVSAIRRSWLRRTVLLILIVPLTVITLPLYLLAGVLECLTEYGDAVKSAWRGDAR